jgi:hypothetical protein
MRTVRRDMQAFSAASRHAADECQAVRHRDIGCGGRRVATGRAQGGPQGMGAALMASAPTRCPGERFLRII